MVASFTDYEGKIQNTKFKAPLPNKKGYPTVNFTLDDEIIRFQLTKPDEPHTRAPFGISFYVEKDASPEKIAEKKKEARKNFDTGIKNQELVKFIQDSEEVVIQAAILNKEKWFKKGETLNETAIRSMFTSSLVIDEQYGARLRTKVNTDMSMKNVVKVVEMNMVDGAYVPKKSSPSEIMKPINCIVIVEIGSLWFQPKSFGMSFVSTDILVFPEDGKEEFAFNLGTTPVQLSSSSSSSSSGSSSESSSSLNGSSSSSHGSSCSSSEPVVDSTNGSNSILFAKSDDPTPPDVTDEVSAKRQKC